MKNKYSALIYFISATILVTISIQLYWNYKNFYINKKTIINKIQISFEKSIENYFTEESKKNITAYFYDARKKINNKKTIIKLMSFSKKDLDISEKKNNKNKIEVIPIKNNPDSISFELEVMNKLAKKVVVSVTKQELNLYELNKLLKFELNKYKINIPFSITYSNYDGKIINFAEIPNLKYSKVINLKSPFLSKNSFVKLNLANLNTQAYKASLIGILLSLVLCLCIIGCLVYLLKIINNQKQLAEIKNDFISNITHELKTPIAVVSSAIEGIQKFNTENNREKTNKYLSISNLELNKLNILVEKILDMATIESKELKLKKELVSINEILLKCISNAKTNTSKNILFSPANAIQLTIDVFHFENAINNLLENAIKYGGETIEVNLVNWINTIEISVSDNGNPIPKNVQQKVFEKFYRIPTQNIHNVKGFGIGLYYVKQIIEKHQGTIQIEPNESKTIFKIMLPNE